MDLIVLNAAMQLRRAFLCLTISRNQNKRTISISMVSQPRLGNLHIDEIKSIKYICCNKPNKIWVKENWCKNDFCDSNLNNKNYSNYPNSQIWLRSYSIMIITECNTASWNVRDKACESSKQNGSVKISKQ